MSQEVYDLEAVDGVRMPWNLWPRSKVEALRCVLPFAALYSPVKSVQGMQVRAFSNGHVHYNSRLSIFDGYVYDWHTLVLVQMSGRQHCVQIMNTKGGCRQCPTHQSCAKEKIVGPP